MIYIVFDLEATCWPEEDSNGLKHTFKLNEVIEVGAVMLNDKLEVLGEFNKFIKPVINPILSPFCKELTSIKQSEVDNADVFEIVMKEFDEWCTMNGNDVELCSWGFYDKSQIKKESNSKSYKGKIISMLNNHISIKHQFAEIKNIRPCGTQKALSLLGFKFNGTQHRAIDDARNITKIFTSVFNQLKF